MSGSLIDRLTEENEILKETIVQLRALLVPSMRPPLKWGLSPSEEKIFQCLTARDVADKNFIWFSLYSDRYGGDTPDEKILTVLVCKMRKKLKPFGVNITTVWGRGFSLENRKSYSKHDA